MVDKIKQPRKNMKNEDKYAMLLEAEAKEYLDQVLVGDNVTHYMATITVLKP